MVKIVVSLLLFRSARPRTTEEESRQIFEKGAGIKEEFAEYFTGEGAIDLIQILLANFMYSSSLYFFTFVYILS